MKRQRKPRRIQTTIALAFTAVVFGTALVIALFSYTFTQDAVQETSQDYTGQLISQVQTSIDSYITHMENITEVVQLNEQVQNYIGGTRTLSPAEEANYRARITSFLNAISRTRNDISLILIAGTNGRVIIHDAEIVLNPAVVIPDQNWYTAALANPGSAAVSSSHVQNIVEGEYRWVITLSRTIDDPVTGETYGVMLVDLNFSVINTLVNRISLGKKGYLFIVDEEGRLVYHPRQELIYSNLETEHIDRVLTGSPGSFTVTDEKGERLYTIRASRRTGWRTVGVNYAAEMVRNRVTIQRYYVFGTLIAVVVAIVVSFLISHRISRPILRLRASMQAVEQGNFDISVDITSDNEIGALAKDFNIMIAQIRELVRRNAQEQELKRKSELMALQNQITPHFLYNTLDSIIWMAEGKQYSNVVTTVSALAKLLRLSISRGDELIAIRDEIEHIRNYLTIQKLRYQDKLDFSITVDDSVLSLQTPKVILQPLVENAIYHGIKNKDAAGHVTISGTIEDHRVVVSIVDDGAGMSPERLEQVREELAGNNLRSTVDNPAVSQGLHHPHRRIRVGVRNVHDRIQLYFGKEYGLVFQSTPTSGTVVEVHLPIVHSPGEENAPS